MPTAPTYPGVYIEEIPSGVRTITGVATSITAFIGRASRGPTNVATIVNSFGDFERIFGGLWAASSMSFAVRDFFLNGGTQAIIVRLYHGEQGKASKAKITVGALKLVARYEGSWGNNLRATVDQDVADEVAQRMKVANADLFNLTVRELGTDGKSFARTEKFPNVTVKESSRRIDRVLTAESELVEWDASSPIDPNNPPAIAAADDGVTKAAADVTKAEKTLAAAQAANPQVPADITAAQTALQTAQTALNTAKTAGEAFDGAALTKSADFTPNNAQADKKGLYALEQADLFNLLCISPHEPGGDIEPELTGEAAAYCETRRAMLVVDSPSGWNTVAKAIAGLPNLGTNSKNSALFFPRIKQRNPLRDNQLGVFVPCGAAAGLFARTDSARGVWKAPAGLDATLVGVPELTVPLTDPENGQLNPLGINCLRVMPGTGRVIWGSRTLQGNDRLASEWKYVPVRRTALYIEESLYRGTQWAVFEPNDEPLWAQLRLAIGAFMHNLFRQGAFQGKSPRDAYFVKCDKETTTQNDINLGIVNIVVGFAPLKPAEFVIIKIQQMAGQIET
jgi:Bacteriophage tail sheath protein